MEIKVIGIGPETQVQASELVAAFEKLLGIKANQTAGSSAQSEACKEGGPAINEVKELLAQIESAQFKLAKKHLGLCLREIKEMGVDFDIAAAAVSELVCLIFHVAGEKEDDESPKEKFVEYIGNLFDTVGENIKERRAKRGE